MPEGHVQDSAMPEGHVQDSAMPEGGAPRTVRRRRRTCARTCARTLRPGRPGVQGHGKDTARTTGGCAKDMRADNRDTDFGRAAKAQPPRAGHIGTNVGVAAGVGVCGCAVSGVWVARVSFVDNSAEGQCTGCHPLDSAFLHGRAGDCSMHLKVKYGCVFYG